MYARTNIQHGWCAHHGDGGGVVRSRVKVRDGGGGRGPGGVLLVGDDGGDGCLGGRGRDGVNVAAGGRGVREGWHARVRGHLAQAVGGQWCLGGQWR